MPAGIVEVDTASGQVLYNGRKLYSSPPAAGIARRLSALTFQNNTLYIIASPLIGHGIEQVLSGLPTDSLAVSLELDLDLHANLSVHSLQADIAYFGPDSIHDLETSFRQWLSEFTIRRVILLNLNGGFRLHANEYNRIRSGLMAMIRAEYQNKATEIHLGRLWVRNTIANYTQAACNPLHIPSCPQELPVVVLGAGPSAELLYPYLRKLSRYAAIIAVDTILPALLAIGVVPDAVVVLEAQFYNVKDFVPGIPRNCTYILDSSSYPSLAHNAPMGSALWVHTRFSSASLFERLFSGILPQLKPEGSVGPAAIQLAEMLFSGPLLCAGIDFAYRVEKTHAAGTGPHTDSLMLRSRMSCPAWYKNAAPRNPYAVKARDNSAVLTDLVLTRYQETLMASQETSHRYSVAGPGLQIGMQNCSPQSFLDRIIAMHNGNTLTETGTNSRKTRLIPNTSDNFHCKKPSIGELRSIMHNEIQLLIAGQETVKTAQRLSPDIDYVDFGLAAASEQQLDIMIRYYIDRWRNALNQS